MKKSYGKRRNDTVFILFSLVLGLLMGWVAKDLENVTVAGAVVSNLGIWVFVSALLAVYSQEGFRAALHVFVYFCGVISAYFTHRYLLGTAVSGRTLLYWVIFAAIGALVGFICWHASQKEWLGAACAAVPISLLAAEAYPIYRGWQLPLILDVVCGVILYVLMAGGKVQKLMVLPFVIVFTFALVYFDVLSQIFGGWI